MPDRCGVPVVTLLVCFLCLHARLRASQTPGIPCALCFCAVSNLEKLGRSAPREREVLTRANSSCPDLIRASSASQAPFEGMMDGRVKPGHDGMEPCLSWSPRGIFAACQGCPGRPRNGS